MSDHRPRQPEHRSSPDLVPVARALLSVSDKSGLVEFARALAGMGVELISTGGTAKALADAGLNPTPIERVTGFPEVMDGRVKTLHPAVHGGLLARRDAPDHARAMQTHGIQPIDLVCVNLYPFESTIARAGVTRDEAVEQIDIGGPSMIRSAAKNHDWVAAVTDPAQYPAVLAELTRTGGATTRALRASLAAEAFDRTARYDAAIADYLLAAAPQAGHAADLPHRLALTLRLAQPMRYGENSHQKAGLYLAGPARDDRTPDGTIASGRQLHGKELSYNNLNDASAALEIVRAITHAALAPDNRSLVSACVVKHMNPCGAATAPSVLDAVQAAVAGDPLAAYGGILAVSATLDDRAASRLCEKDIFMEVIVAPGFAPDAADRLRARWANLRLVEVGEIRPASPDEIEVRSVPGSARRPTAFLVQQRDVTTTPPASIAHLAGPAPTTDQLAAASFLECVGRALMSNAVCVGGSQPDGGGLALFGAGAGQMDRVTACRIATEKAGARARGAVAYSDAFFPFADGPRILIEAGVSCLVHPGGSKRDHETFDLCRERGVTCLVTGLRHFRH
ncbi:MAG: bifunctional phosphoribosylaminoimidazolecarboxamide formyltransferase/IMP cyclohydrolase [Phycisphaeraceae bacterium]|nr:MAG: bifunctional phosphoribosylaminoimidazolecarboxamide formyltransferase/IMP cyclohydrolase [Phycisphaeraceae bacterium]